MAPSSKKFIIHDVLILILNILKQELKITMARTIILLLSLLSFIRLTTITTSISSHEVGARILLLQLLLFLSH